MIYQYKRHNLTKAVETCEVAGGTLRLNDVSVPLAELTELAIIKDFFGCVTVRMRAPRLAVTLRSHTAAGLGKAIDNRTGELVALVKEVIAGAPADLPIHVGSNGWKWTGYASLALVGLAVVLFAVMLVMMAVDPARQGRNGPPLLKFWIVPILGFAAWRMVRIGGRRRLGTAEAVAYLDAL